MRFLPLAFSAALLASGCVVVHDNTCNDGVRDGNESDVDCGGSCAACGVGAACFSPADCVTGICAGGRCASGAQNTCANGRLDPGEVDVDCGGPCPACAGQHHTITDGLPPQGTTVYRIKPGASAVISPGQQAGYAITANFGGSYRLVWTGDAAQSGSYHEFWGAVYSPGSFTSVTPGCAQNFCPLEQGDYVSQPTTVNGGEAIYFDTFATVGIDGFDFVVNAEPVYFDVFIDGQRYPQLIFFYATDTNQIANTAVLPFGLTTQ